MPTVKHQNGALAIEENMTWGRRSLFIFMGFFPLLAPYELLLRPGWTSFANLPFLFSLGISLGATMLSAFLFFIAFAGLSTLMVFDPHASTFTFRHHAPIVPLQRELLSFDSIQAVDLDKHDWSDGEPTYSIRVHIEDGRTFKSSSFTSLEQATSTCRQVEELLNS